MRDLNSIDIESLTSAEAESLRAEYKSKDLLSVRFYGKDLSEAYAVVTDYREDRADYWFLFWLDDQLDPFKAEKFTTMPGAMAALAMAFVYDNCESPNSQDDAVNDVHNLTVKRLELAAGL